MKKLVSILLIAVLCFTLTPNTASASVKISKKNITLEIGESTTLKISGTKAAVKWISNDEEIVTVTSKGKLTAVSDGNTLVVATVNKKKYTCKVTVTNPVKVKAEDLVNGLVNAGMKIGKIIVYDESTDPNGILGRPNEYIGKVNFEDTRVTQYEPEHPTGGTIEVFNNADDALVRYDYVDSLIGSDVLWQYLYLHDNVLLRIDYDLTPKQAKEYDDALTKLLK